jgi:small GTP-binding protein
MSGAASAKVVFLGPVAVGKTMLVRRICDGEYGEFASPTAASQLDCVQRCVDGAAVQLCLWDTAGQERFASLGPAVYRGADIAVLCHDPSDLGAVTAWAKRVRDAAPDCRLFLVLTKADLHDCAAIDADKAALAEFARAHGAGQWATSAQSGDGVDALLDALAREAARCLADKSRPLDPVVAGGARECC